MKIEGSNLLAALPAEVFESLIDPLVLQKTIPGCERMERIGEDEYAAHLKIGSGMIKGSYSGKVRITEKSAPRKLTLQIEGKGTPGFVNGSAVVELSEEGQGTKLVYLAEVQVGGLIAMVGSRMIEATAKKLAADFFKNLESKVTRT